jgi:hypothetical protein
LACRPGFATKRSHSTFKTARPAAGMRKEWHQIMIRPIEIVSL